MFGKDTAALDAVMARLDEIDAGTKASIEGLRNHLDERLDQIALQISANKEATDASLLEVVTAITTAFMTETIEIKQGVEAIVDVLSQAAAPAAPATSDKGPCQVKGCDKAAEVVTSWKTDILTPAEDVAVCEGHAQMMAKQAFQAPPKSASATPVATPAAPDREKFAKEHGIGEGEPDPDVLTPEPLDPITAAIEAQYRAGKSA